MLIKDKIMQGVMSQNFVATAMEVNKVREELDSILNGDSYIRRKFNAYINDICEENRLYPKLQLLKKGRKKLYTLSTTLWIWIKVWSYTHNIKTDSILEMLTMIRKKDKPFDNPEFFTYFQLMIEKINQENNIIGEGDK